LGGIHALAVAMAEFNNTCNTKSIHIITRDDVNITEQDLVAVPGTVTEVVKNINVGILYIESWLRGHGAVAL
jgi:malate synthase